MKLRITEFFKSFIESEKTGGFLLILCTVISIAITNSDAASYYLSLWHTKTGFNFGPVNLTMSVEHWINDGLMAVFFLLIGLEIERELYRGELSDFKNALMPVFAAAGGMIVPALLFLKFNYGAPTQNGFGIPMATDIAFSLGVLSLLGSRVPFSLKVFLTALAIIDDLGAIIIIALFYSKNLSPVYLGGAAGIICTMIIMNRGGIRRLIFYIVPGFILWYCMLKSGVHATIAGVILAFCIPFTDGGENSPSHKLEKFLHRPVPFIILPLFALANTCVTFTEGWYRSLLDMNSLGIISGLFIGKPAGILLFCLIAVKLNISKLPEDLKWGHITGAGMLAGIGFTMSIFITLLAYSDNTLVINSKIAILMASLMAGVAGFLYLHIYQRKVR